MFKKIYIEITNKCNLNCSFCSKSNRKIKEVSVEEFEYIVKKIDKYTDYLYLHVKGEPLLHKDLDGILNVARKYKKKVNITTNGSLLEKKIDVILNNSDVIRQINISIHSLANDFDYLDMVLYCVLKILDNSDIIVSLRLWNIDKGIDNNYDVYEFLKNKYGLSSSLFEKIKNDDKVKIRKNLYLNKDRVFVWPNINNDYYSEFGKCYGTRSHIGILSDGTVVPCCLDGDGIIRLGNIYEDEFESIINSKLFKEIKEGFIHNKKVCELCRKCSFLDK